MTRKQECLIWVVLFGSGALLIVLYAMGVREVEIEMLVLYAMAIFMATGFGSLVAKRI